MSVSFNSIRSESNSPQSSKAPVPLSLRSLYKKVVKVAFVALLLLSPNGIGAAALPNPSEAIKKLRDRQTSALQQARRALEKGSKKPQICEEVCNVLKKSLPIQYSKQAKKAISGQKEAGQKALEREQKATKNALDAYPRIGPESDYFF